VDVAAIMLENVTVGENTNPDGSSAPRIFASTGQTLTIPAKLCEDTDGAEFRLSGFHRGCMKLCPDGFASSCDESRAKTFCYRETQFNINQRDIESGKILTQSGLALGNFNYRIESVGLNFVGSGIRNCSQSTLPSTCYSSGNVPYSIEHWGPYFVRNYEGQDYEAKLFTGRVEHARGLATERYLTNPLSSDDASLMQQYLRAELQGRPLDGNFVLRVWDDDSVNFRAIQDVQVVLKYRYWTRFN
jgi:hypothetical protein